MSGRPLRVLDASALVAFFGAHPRLMDLLDDTEKGRVGLLLPTTAIAVAQEVVAHTMDEWSAILLVTGVRSMPLAEHCAIEVGGWPGDLATRHAVHEAHSMGAVIVTRDPGLYQGYELRLLVV